MLTIIMPLNIKVLCRLMTDVTWSISLTKLWVSLLSSPFPYFAQMSTYPLCSFRFPHFAGIYIQAGVGDFSNYCERFSTRSEDYFWAEVLTSSSKLQRCDQLSRHGDDIRIIIEAVSHTFDLGEWSNMKHDNVPAHSTHAIMDQWRPPEALSHVHHFKTVLKKLLTWNWCNFKITYFYFIV